MSQRCPGQCSSRGPALSRTVFSRGSALSRTVFSCGSALSRTVFSFQGQFLVNNISKYLREGCQNRSANSRQITWHCFFGKGMYTVCILVFECSKENKVKYVYMERNSLIDYAFCWPTSAYLSASLSLYLSDFLSESLNEDLYVNLSVSLSLYLSAYLSECLSAYLSLSLSEICL